MASTELKKLLAAEENTSMDEDENEETETVIEPEEEELITKLHY
jgi:hypothetical protein